MSAHISTSHFVSAFAARTSILRMRSRRRFEVHDWTSKLFRTHAPSPQVSEVIGNSSDEITGPDGGGAANNVVRQVRQTTWPEVTRLFNAGLAGLWAMAVFLVVGFAACHITGPSVVMSVVIASITSVMTGTSLNEYAWLSLCQQQNAVLTAKMKPKMTCRFCM
jgi:hypothetical protein